MKFSVSALAAFAAVTSTSSRYMVAAAAAPKSKKSAKKVTNEPNGAVGGVSKGTCDPPCDIIPPGLDHTVCRKKNSIGSSVSSCQNGQPGALCAKTSDCVVQTDLDPPHAVCRLDRCQSGKSGASCGDTDDCVIPKGLDHAVCRRDKCQR